MCEAFAETLSVAGSLTVVYQPLMAIEAERVPLLGRYGASLERAPRLLIDSVLSHNGTLALSATMKNGAGHVIDEWKAHEHVSDSGCSAASHAASPRRLACG